MALPVDIITLENFEDKMPRWDPASSSHLYALVDMGSNGIRFSISDLSPPRARLLKCIYRERAAISLFDALNKDKKDKDEGDDEEDRSVQQATSSRPLTFPVETIDLVARTLARFRGIAVNDYGVPPAQVTVFATEAMRRAQNATAMLEAIRVEAPDLVVHILEPQVETLFGSVGARSGFTHVKGLFLDLGGGSVQMTYMDTVAAAAAQAQNEGQPGYEVKAALAGQSLPFGAARLIRVLESTDTEMQTTEISKLSSGMTEAFAKLRSTFPTLEATAASASDDDKYEDDKDNSGVDIYLCGGGFRGYGSMLMHTDPIQPYPIPAIGSYTVSGKAFVRTKDMLKVNKTFDGKIFGLSKRRRAQFPAIVTVVDALIAAVPRIRSVTFCSGGNREGALMMKLPQEIRESDPVAHLHAPLAPSITLAQDQEEAQQDARLQVVVDALLSALPENLKLASAVNVFGLHLSPLYASQIWARAGDDADANASAALHDAVTRNPGCPGLTHLARAVLGLTLCARWGSNLGPIDQQLHHNLRMLLDAADPDAAFWADYTGAVAAALATVVSASPKSQGAVEDNVKFHCTAENGKKKLKIRLTISVNDRTASGIDLDDLADLFRKVGKKKDDKKVDVTITRLG
ncbi:Ppx/GppA phosphatase family-domain-containing protein [Bombardia bombarda]|uniref:Ppx/GppA phosphatase family-domain-containing protein n=1 Tax=Bombardia bombarda TaxID=252184 RepID=A0AA39WMQ4_9PEZI|nr:Ppx/GppA phosphatase family-domain-containing protein [Bombardia bombarda]